ncbi:MAG TPA: ABC transporter permease [Bryobacteraceae bacterium]|nr:ABC transporter permease [Bryobacteraceae bacterium]
MAENSSGDAGFRPQLANAIRLACDSLIAHRLRTFLTLLGIMIGVASVILVGSAIDGVGVYAEQSTAKAFGGESFVLQQITNAKSRREFFDKLKRNHELKLTDEHYLEVTSGDDVQYSAYAANVVDTKRGNITDEETAVIGAEADIIDIRNLTIVDGRFFTRTEEQNAAYVAIIGDDLKNNLFPDGASPVGRTFKIQDLDFTVVGVQERLGSSFGRNQDNSCMIPITVYSRLFGPGRSLTIFGKAKDSTGLSLDDAVNVTRVALRSHFHQKPGETDKFEFITPDAIRGFIDSLLALVAAVVVPITSISLVVGGIVIMNIMLVSVTERTREIGIRKSLGARRSDIMMQVLIEAVIMAFAGGAIGVGIGATVTKILTAALGITLRVTPAYVLLSVFVSGAVGVISGWYPASKASKLDPIVALRAE